MEVVHLPLLGPGAWTEWVSTSLAPFLLPASWEIVRVQHSFWSQRWKRNVEWGWQISTQPQTAPYQTIIRERKKLLFGLIYSAQGSLSFSRFACTLTNVGRLPGAAASSGFLLLFPDISYVRLFTGFLTIFALPCHLALIPASQMIAWVLSCTFKAFINVKVT